jgi:hypothetical protein
MNTGNITPLRIVLAQTHKVVGRYTILVGRLLESRREPMAARLKLYAKRRTEAKMEACFLKLTCFKGWSHQTKLSQVVKERTEKANNTLLTAAFRNWRRQTKLSQDVKERAEKANRALITATFGGWRQVPRDANSNSLAENATAVREMLVSFVRKSLARAFHPRDDASAEGPAKLLVKEKENRKRAREESAAGGESYTSPKKQTPLRLTAAQTGGAFALGAPVHPPRLLAVVNWPQGLAQAPVEEQAGAAADDMSDA